MLGKPRILDELDTELGRLGLVGERRAAKLLFLALVSRRFGRPVSVVVKGPSSGGKSFVVETVLKFFPPEAFYSLTAMSDRALAYSAEPLRHRHLVIYEAAGMASEFATYLIRSLLSEGRLRYETVEKTDEGLVSRMIEKEGPTGLIVTTTSVWLHPENETRLLSITITDSSEQTAAVFQALAKDDDTADIDLARWHAVQTWLATGPSRVVIPFAERLARLVPPLAIRLRRDFRTVLMLIRAHALLHQATRLKDGDGKVVATLQDYADVRDLVADLVAEGVDATIKPEVRETVEAVGRLIDGGMVEVRQTDLRSALKLDRSVISRRVATALDGGFLKNLEDRKGRPARLVLGDPLPANREVLPSPNQLAETEPLHGCTQNSPDREGEPPVHDPPREVPERAADPGQAGRTWSLKISALSALWTQPASAGIEVRLDGRDLVLSGANAPSADVLEGLRRPQALYRGPAATAPRAAPPPCSPASPGTGMTGEPSWTNRSTSTRVTGCRGARLQQLRRPWLYFKLEITSGAMPHLWQSRSTERSTAGDRIHWRAVLAAQKECMKAVHCPQGRGDCSDRRDAHQHLKTVRRHEPTLLTGGTPRRAARRPRLPAAQAKNAPQHLHQVVTAGSPRDSAEKRFRPPLVTPATVSLTDVEFVRVVALADRLGIPAAARPAPGPRRLPRQVSNPSIPNPMEDAMTS